jgi:hypothetical protein
MEKINLFIVAFPTFDSVVDKIKDAIEDAFEEPKKFVAKQKSCGRKFETPKRCNEDLTPPKFRINKPCNGVEPWGVFGEPADENKRFGAEFAIDEPRCEDYDCRWEFEDDHKAFDKFVEAGEDCVERGLARPEGVTAHRCEAIRQPLGCPPPFGKELIGETHWWDCID